LSIRKEKGMVEEEVAEELILLICLDPDEEEEDDDEEEEEEEEIDLRLDRLWLWLWLWLWLSCDSAGRIEEDEGGGEAAEKGPMLNRSCS
jgi:hypothetical protein